MGQIKKWWNSTTINSKEESGTQDPMHTPIKRNQRRSTIAIILVSFGWAFLLTGMFVGESIAPAESISDLITALTVGNLTLLIISFLLGYIAYKTGFNTQIIYRMVFGNKAMVLPAMLGMIVGLGWQASFSGMFAEIWVGPEVTPLYFLLGVLCGLLVIAACYYGMKGLEYISWPAMICLTIVMVVSIVIGLNNLGGISGVETAAQSLATNNPMSISTKINIIIGSWIVGAMFVGDFTRFAKNAWAVFGFVAINFLVVQPALQIMGITGVLSFGNYNPAAYLAESGSFIWIMIMLSLVLAIWTTGNTNLYFTQTPLSNVFGVPRRKAVIILGSIGAIAGGAGMFNYFATFINVLAGILPPILGPVLYDFYVIHKRNYSFDLLDKLPKINVPAILAYIIGAIFPWFYTPNGLAIGIWGIIISIIAYAIIGWIYVAKGKKYGYMVALEKAQMENPEFRSQTSERIRTVL